MKLKLRPHHLLCTQGFVGMGYSEDFVVNMKEITTRLRTEEQTPIEIVFSTDSICESCPLKLDTDLCKDQECVKFLDNQVIQHFDIEEGENVYQEVIADIYHQVTPETMDAICSTCSWYRKSACKENILNGKYVREKNEEISNC